MSIFLKKINKKNIELKSYVKWLNDKEVNKYLELRFNETTPKDIINFINKNKKNKRTFVFGIFINKNNKSQHIGNITLGPINKFHKFGEIGFFIGEKNFWNKGIMSLAIQQIIKIAKKKFKLKKLIGGCYEINEASKKLFIKNKFKLEGKL